MKTPLSAVLLAMLSLSCFGILSACQKKPVHANISASVQALKTGDTDAKANACAELAKGGPDSAGAVPDLIQALKDKDPLVRHLAAYALGQIGPQAASALPALKEALNDSDRQVVSDAMIALRALGDTNANLVIPNVMTAPASQP
jgi:HEAT repeat protein